MRNEVLHIIFLMLLSSVSCAQKGKVYIDLKEALLNKDSVIHLDLSFKELTELDTSIGQLVKLKTLNLSNNCFTKLPNEIGALVELEEFIMNENHYPKPKKTKDEMEVGDIVQLFEVVKKGSPLMTLPDTIRDWKKLKKLSLKGSLGRSTSENTSTPYFSGVTRSGSLPKVIFELRQLEYLDISNNYLGRIPPEIDSLIKLKYLNLSFNRSYRRYANGLMIGPNNPPQKPSNPVLSIPSLKKLKHLEELDLRKNGLEKRKKGIQKELPNTTILF